MDEILIPLGLLTTIFGIAYLYLTTRNKERLALIEKGVDASIFLPKNNNFQKFIILNFGLLLTGIGIGIFIALFLSTFTTLNQDALYPASIFMMAGITLLIGFKMTKNNQ